MRLLQQNRPEATNSLDRAIRRKTALPTDQAVFDAVLPVGSVTNLAVLLVHRFAVHDRAAAVGQTLAVRSDVDIPKLDFFWCR